MSPNVVRNRSALATSPASAYIIMTGSVADIGILDLERCQNSQHFHPHLYNGSAWCGPDRGAKLANTTAQSQSRARPELGSD